MWYSKKCGRVIVQCVVVAFVCCGLPGRCVTAEEGDTDVALEVYREKPGAQENRGRLRTTAIGHPSSHVTTTSQKRLLAKRAATLRAYRNLVRALDKMESHLESGSGVVSVDGFIKGATITQTRYFSDGRVEVTMVVPVAVKKRTDRQLNNQPEGYNICEIDPSAEEITEERWIELTGQ